MDGNDGNIREVGVQARKIGETNKERWEKGLKIERVDRGRPVEPHLTKGDGAILGGGSQERKLARGAGWGSKPRKMPAITKRH